jgi:hypothetical protein
MNGNNGTGAAKNTRTKAELLDAIEGLRCQLSTFSDQALGQIESLKFWVQRIEEVKTP